MSSRAVLVGVVVIVDPVGPQPFPRAVRATPESPASLLEPELVAFHPQPVFHRLQASAGMSVRSSKLPGVAVAVVPIPHQPTQ